jgi:hypothetical protein
MSIEKEWQILCADLPKEKLKKGELMFYVGALSVLIEVARGLDTNTSKLDALTSEAFQRVRLLQGPEVCNDRG